MRHISPHQPRSVRYALPLLLTALAPAQSPSPTVLDDGTTHYYQVVATPSGITWADALVAAAQAGGYLATIQSDTENEFVFRLLDDPKFWTTNAAGTWVGPWTGGSQTPSAKEPAGGFRWNEFETFAYTKWATGQPDNDGGADRILFGGSTTGRSETWADAPASHLAKGYVIEFSGTRNPRTVGLHRRDAESFDGYTLMAPNQSKTTWLLDPRGRVVNTWTSTFPPGVAAYLLPNGNLLRTAAVGDLNFFAGGVGGAVQIFDWKGSEVWNYRYSSKAVCQHHDVEILPNGNILILAWERIDRAAALAAGRDPNKLPDDEIWPEKIIEVKPSFPSGGTIVWEWRSWDHIVQNHDNSKPNYGDPAKHPGRFDLNYTAGVDGADWMHANSITYNTKLDQILISCHHFNEVWIIDHSTTTAQAATGKGGRSGKGGEVLYRWGNPEAYGSGTVNDRQLFGQHDAQWIAEGLSGATNILIFNNGNGRTPAISTVVEIVAPKPDALGNYARSGSTWGPAKPAWSYGEAPGQKFYAPFISGCQRLPNGNTLICSGPNGRSFEVTQSGKTVWEYRNPIGPLGAKEFGAVRELMMVFRTPRYAPSYPAFKNRTLTPGGPVETYTGAALLADGSTTPRRAKVGTSVELSLLSGTEAGDEPFYRLATSLTPGLIGVDHRFIRLGTDPLLVASMTGAFPTVFQDYAGRFDEQGRASASIAIPALASAAGLNLYTSFLVTDPTAPSTIAKISNTVIVRIER